MKKLLLLALAGIILLPFSVYAEREYQFDIIGELEDYFNYWDLFTTPATVEQTAAEEVPYAKYGYDYMSEFKNGYSFVRKQNTAWRL